MHPGLGNEESQAIDPGWRVRQTDYEFLTSREARELLQQEGIAVIDYSAIQQVWSPASAPRQAASESAQPSGRHDAAGQQLRTLVNCSHRTLPGPW